MYTFGGILTYFKKTSNVECPVNFINVSAGIP